MIGELIYYAVGVAIISAASYASLSIGPIPITLQSLAVLLVAATFRGRGTLIVAAWLFVGAAGAPVFAGGASGMHHLTGAGAGFLWGMLIAARYTQLAAHRGETSTFSRAIGTFAVGTGIILTIGYGRLAFDLGPVQAWYSGVQPFLAGAVIKVLAGAALVSPAERVISRVEAR
ncbi:MAG: biotin transporter BioY [Myxococcota bacterium]